MSHKENVRAVIREAKTYLGVPYVLGGLSREGIDCRGLGWLNAMRAADMVAVTKTTELLYATVAELDTALQKRESGASDEWEQSES